MEKLIVTTIIAGAFGVSLAAFGLGYKKLGFWVLLGLFVLYGAVNRY
jgi:hypothetical protein